MARKDPKGRVLRTGEVYRADKGLYIFQYTDPLGKRHTLYAPNIMELRKKEDELTYDRMDNIKTYVAGRTSLNYAYQRYIALKFNLKPSTKANYNYIYDHFIKETIGRRLLKDIKYSDIKFFYYYLINEWGVKPMTVENVHTILHPVFQMAIRDNIIRTNPATGVMREIKRSNLWKVDKRHSLTEEQTDAFLGYTRDHPQYDHWYNLFIVFFGTGMRVSEVCGLCWEDLDFEKREIHVRRNLIYMRWDEDKGKANFHVTSPKTQNGTRVIPMTDGVYDAFLQEYTRQKEIGFCKAEVDGVKGFVFRNRFGSAMHQGSINRAIKRVYTSYNEEELLNAARENRKPLLIPAFSCHHIRHTFCTRLCERETNLKAIQDIMGHADVQTTLNIYAEATDKVKHEAMKALQSGKDVF